MRSILVANLKGGCGKTVISTTLATALAARGDRVALADADKQKSSLRWGKQRPSDAAGIEMLDWTKSSALGERPKKLDWLVIDAPGALSGDRAEDLVAEARAVLVPVTPSFFDIDATKRFLKRVDDMKRVRKGKAEISVIANRVRARSRAAAGLDERLSDLDRAPLARIAERAIYAELAEQGLGLFDRNQKAFDPIKAQWAPVLEMLDA